MDSCVWVENERKYKSDQKQDMKDVKKVTTSANTNRNYKEANKTKNNKDRHTDTKKAQRDNLASGVLPMKEYPSPLKDKVTSFTDQEQERKFSKEFEEKIRDPIEINNLVNNSH